MRYVDSVIMPGEKLLATAHTHWFIYAVPVFWLLLAIGLTVVVPPAGLVAIPLALTLVLRAWIYAFSTELAVTSKRIIAKFGFIRRSTVELRHDKIESLQVDQGIVGRIFDFGSVTLTGSGGTHAPIPFIAQPLRFRSAALTGIEAET